MDFSGDQISTPPVEEIPVEEGGQIEDATPEQEQPDAQALLLEKVNGLETAIGREREERRILQAKAEYLEQLAFQKAAASEPSLDPDDFPTNNDVKSMVSKEVEVIKESLKQQQIVQMEEQAKVKFPDFEEVVGTFTKELVNQNPDLYNVIMNSKNPPETAYKFGQTHTKYLEKLQKNTAQKIAKKIDSNVNSTPTLSSLGGVSNDRVNPGFYNSLPKKDFEKLVAEVMGQP